MIRTLKIVTATAAILSAASVAALADSGGPGGKGVADGGTLATQQAGGATANSDYVTSNPDRMNTDREMRTAEMGDQAAAQQSDDDRTKTSHMGPASYASH